MKKNIAVALALLMLILLGNIIAASVMAADPTAGENPPPAANRPQQVQADLSVRKTAPTEAIVYSPMSYTISVSNSGPSTATSVVVTDHLPFNISINVQASSSQGNCTYNRGLTKWVACQLGNLGSGSIATVTTVFTPSAQGEIVSTVEVTSSTPDPDLDDNEATVTTTVKNAADLSISYDSQPNPVTPGAVVTYSLTFTNSGPAEDARPTVTNSLPAGIKFGGVVSTSSPATPTVSNGGRLIVWQAAKMREGVTRRVVYTGSVTDSISGGGTATVTIRSDLYDPDKADNMAVTSTTIGSEMVSVSPTLSETVVYSDSDGGGVTTTVPAGAVDEETTILYTDQATPTHPTAHVLAATASTFAGRAFGLDAFRDGNRLPGFVFQKPVIITIKYTDADVAGLDENALRLDYWDGSQWQDAATTCSPASAYDRNPDHNRLSVSICHLSDFALFERSAAATFHIYLPLVLRDW